MDDGKCEWTRRARVRPRGWQVWVCFWSLATLPAAVLGYTLTGRILGAVAGIKLCLLVLLAGYCHHRRQK